MNPSDLEIIYQDARCAGTDPEPFFDPARYAEAKAICQPCPVKDACLAHAIDHEHYGVWGGESPESRRLLRAQRRLSA